MSCGIYLLRFSGTDAVYIGQSNRVEYRYTQHLYKLRNKTSSQKLQKAFETYGVPSLEIILECPEDDLDINEKEAIGIWNSAIAGLNTYEEPRGSPIGLSRERGENSATSKYTNEQISLVLFYLVYNNTMTAKQISEETSVGVHTVRAVSSLNEHIWLKEAYPKEYELLEQYKGMSNKSYKYDSASRGITYPDILSPEGIIYSNISNVKQFCREHGLQDSNFLLLLKGRRKSHKGWKLA